MLAATALSLLTVGGVLQEYVGDGACDDYDDDPDGDKSDQSTVKVKVQECGGTTRAAADRQRFFAAL
ncbi:hypothetical protein LPA44_02940 [Halobacterium sp. KA-4]|uniref:hypothetical protein n=1 Tax=Halobacterium sp. KA-4 TaxID=2896367 RepID=UPI001E4B8A85|nr:hypothetical protein [Halobacterium sp. KA-4]MCD2198855.1 hypothetical protein [Halobacterium sp. KA-4]